MKYSVLPVLLPLMFMFGCSTNSGTKSENDSDSVAVQMEKDSLSAESAADDIDWAPEEFKAEHPDEWAVVNSAINIQQMDGNADFGKIDILVKDYLKKKKISLPTDIVKQIEFIEEVCRTKFDISSYDLSNMGMHVADGTRRLFDSYIDWLYESEAKKVLVRDKFVNIDRELKMYENLNDAIFAVCDSVTFSIAGSGGWIAGAQIHDISIDFHRCLCQAVIGATFEKKCELDVPLDLFDKECEALNDSYDPYDDDQPKDVSHIVNRFKNAFHSWYAYRKSVAASLKDAKFKKAYESITYGFARLHFLHLKNRYSDIGMMDGSMEDLCLKEDCSNKELLDFNYESKYKELFRN